jgi:uncharacterized protein YbcI
MHVELPKAKKFKEFGGEYVMIVISIITALGLEHAVQSYHHRHLAHEATARIEAELRTNLSALDDTIAHNKKEEKKTRALRVAFVEELRAGTPEKAAIDHLFEKKGENGVSLSVLVPTLRHEAWDVAVANQAASWIEPEQLEGYAALYAHIRDIGAISNGSGNKFLNGPQFVNLFADLQIGRANAQDVLRILNQIEHAYDAENGNQEGLRDDIGKRFKVASVTAQR